LGLLYGGYKRAADLTELGWLLDRQLEGGAVAGTGEYEPLCRASNDTTDAVVSALRHRASARI
jgi:hypothetical protein